jgi:hypothetical protein
MYKSLFRLSKSGYLCQVFAICIRHWRQDRGANFKIIEGYARQRKTSRRLSRVDDVGLRKKGNTHTGWSRRPGTSL